MPTPGSGSISISNFSSEVGWASNANNSLSWVYSNTKSGYQSYSMNNLRNLAWYQKTNAGNCNNGNCTSNCNCGNIQCTNCYISGGVNCVNCDGRAWFQPNCNCACTYNCNVGPVSYNCDCNCDCNCNCGG